MNMLTRFLPRSRGMAKGNRPARRNRELNLAMALVVFIATVAVAPSVAMGLVVGGGVALAIYLLP